MQGISDISIIGIDETRPPFIRKEPYIDIYFKLSHQAPLDWCKDLNSIFAIKHPSNNAKIDEKEGLFIKTWVRSPEQITSLFEQIKTEITECTRQYIERIQLAARSPDNTDSLQDSVSSAQANLNLIISSLDFG